MFWLYSPTTEAVLPVSVLRIVSPAVVLLAALSVLAARPLHRDSEGSPITSVVVATTVPRRAAILSFLSLVAATYLADGLTFAVFAVLSKHWPGFSDLPINTVIGLTGFAGLAAVGAWKDVAGVDVWSLRRIKMAVALSLVLDIALTGLLGWKIRDTGTSLFHRNSSVGFSLPPLYSPST